MGFRYWVRQFTPRFFLHWYRAWRDRSSSDYIWEGVYRQYSDVPVSKNDYSADHLVSDTMIHTRRQIELSTKPDIVPTGLTVEHSFLSFLISLISRDRASIRVLDFGGGMGISYVHLKTGAISCDKVDYHIVENKAMCEAGAKLFDHDPQIHFHDTLPTEISKVDVVYICSSLQYIESYAELLDALCCYSPDYFLFVKLSSGNIPTYATAQKNLRGVILPYWFINIQEIIQIMAGNGYSLIFKSTLDREYDQGNFSVEYRLGRACNLLFRRANV